METYRVQVFRLIPGTQRRWKQEYQITTETASIAEALADARRQCPTLMIVEVPEERK